MRSVADLAGSKQWEQRVGGYCALPGLIAQLGGAPAVELARADLAASALDDRDAHVPYHALAKLLHGCAESTGCAHLGLLAGRIWRLSDLGVLGEVTRHSPTVRDALQALTVLQQLNSHGGLAYLIERGGWVDFGYAVYHPDVTHADQVYDAILAAGFNYLRELCGPDWLPSEVLIPHARPADTGPWRRLFKVTPRFNAETAALRFSASFMDAAVDGAQAVSLRAAQRRIAGFSGHALVAQVIRALRLVLVHGKCSGDDVAAELSMHRRTLNRRLRAHGTTFQRVLDQVRYDVARQMLRESDIALDDIAATLGYAGVSPFMRTFRRWSGTTPARWRRNACTRATSRPAAPPAGDGSGQRAAP
jgi:AraC-like DNA-binding protein